MSTPVMFLSGAGLPSWAWDDVRRALDVESRVADYPRRPGAGLADYAEAVLEQVPWPSYSLVGHSIGGVVAAEVVSRAGGAVTGVVGVASVVPEPGGSFVSALPFPQRLLLPVILRVFGTKPPDGALRKGQGAGLDAETADRMVAGFEPESRQLYTDRVSTHVYPARTGYVLTTDDHELPLPLQETFAKRLGAGWTRRLPTGHLPMLQDPAGLAAALAQFRSATMEA